MRSESWREAIAKYEDQSHMTVRIKALTMEEGRGEWSSWVTQWFMWLYANKINDIAHKIM